MVETEWTLESLNKAYQQGYMTGLAGKDSDECPYQNDILIAAWEAGWDDGSQQYSKAMKERRQIRYA
jgi:ribosome modulation factor